MSYKNEFKPAKSKWRLPKLDSKYLVKQKQQINQVS